PVLARNAVPSARFATDQTDRGCTAKSARLRYGLPMLGSPDQSEPEQRHSIPLQFPVRLAFATHKGCFARRTSPDKSASCSGFFVAVILPLTAQRGHPDSGTH